MILDTRRLFIVLLGALEVDTVADVGSMNGHDALAFRRVLPRARVLAFEANPHNVEAMKADASLLEQRIEIYPVAVTNFDGVATFHLVAADYSSDNNRRGMSSLLERGNPALRDRQITVPAARLDTSLKRDGMIQRRLALWLDVEGKACEVLEGAAGLLDELLLLHVECESTPCVAQGQKLYPELRQFLRDAGFVQIATNHPPSFEQFNAVFVRGDLPTLGRRAVRRHLGWLWLRARAASGWYGLKRTWQ